jgi:hypothetical protein
MLIEWVAKLLKWKRIKFGKVSDSFQLSQSLVFLILEELERYLVDVMINIEFDDDDRESLQNMLRSDHFPVWFAKKYIDFLDSNKWSKNNIARMYCCNFVVMARKYRMYWNAIRCGDKVVQETIFCSWIGIFSLLKKLKYVDIAFNTIEQEYGTISYKDLEQMRQNSYVRFNQNDFSDNSNTFYCVALDECQEIINSWTKKIPMGNDGSKWVEHSKNLMFARQCINFENREYRRGHVKHDVDCLNEVSFKEKTSCSRLKTRIPARSMEKIKVYKFINLLVRFELIDDCDFNSKLGDKLIQKITGDDDLDDDIDEDMTEHSDDILSQEVEEDSLHQCMLKIFNTTKETDTMKNKDDDLEDEETDIETNNETNRTTCHKLSLVPIFKEGIKKLTEMKIVESRTKRRMRLKRNYTFFLDINMKVTNYIEDSKSKIESLNLNSDFTTPSFCVKYRELTGE